MYLKGALALIIEENIKMQLEQLLHRLLAAASGTAGISTLQTATTYLSWSLYGVTYRWNLDGRHEPPSALSDRLVPLIRSGISLLGSSSGGE